LKIMQRKKSLGLKLGPLFGVWSGAKG
jgi:hypothetical protein